MTHQDPTAMTPQSNVSAADIIRQSLNVVLAPAMWISSSTEPLFGLGRSISEQSAASSTPLVPFGAAFSIWVLIFLGLFAYAFIQALPRNRARQIYRDTGWWTAGSFALITAWGLAAAFPPVDASRWITALIFVPAMLLICRAVVIANERRDELSGKTLYFTLWPLSWLAGWCSIAVFLNWAQLGVHGPIGFGLPVLWICLLTLAAALGWAAIMMRATRGSFAYLFPIIWGLAFLALDRLRIDEISLPIGITAIAGIVVLTLSALNIRRLNRVTI